MNHQDIPTVTSHGQVLLKSLESSGGMSHHDTLHSIFTTQSTRWISEQLSSISLWSHFFFFSKLHLFYIYFWAEHHLSPPSKPSSQDRSKLTQILFKLQIIREQSWHPKHSNQPRTSVVYSESEREGGNLKRKLPGTWALRRKAIVWNRLEQGSLCQTPLPGTPRNLPHPVKVGSVSELFLGRPFPG